MDVNKMGIFEFIFAVIGGIIAFFLSIIGAIIGFILKIIGTACGCIGCIFLFTLAIPIAILLALVL